MPATTDEQAPTQGYQLINRVSNYPIVTKVWDSAKGYYQTAKDSSSLIRYGCETVESNLEKSVKMIEPVLQSESIKKYSEPILVKADELGCRQLDHIEDISTRLVKKGSELNDTYQSSKQIIEQRITSISNDVKATTKSLAEMSKYALEEKIVPPVDDYLRTSVLGVPISYALDVTEKVADRILPEQPKGEEKLQVQVGPVRRAGKLSKRLQTELVKMTLRTPEQLNSMIHVVDLIQYAKTHLDSGVRVTNEFVNDSITKGKDTAKLVYTKQQQTVKDVSQRIHNVTHDTIIALNHAIEVLSQQVPTPVANLTHSTYDALKERTRRVGAQLETLQDLSNFHGVAQKGITSLEQAHALLSSYVTDHPHNTVPAQVVTTVATTIDHVVESLITFLKQNSVDPKTDKIPSVGDAPTTSAPAPQATSQTQPHVPEDEKDDEEEDQFIDEEEEQF